MIVCEVESVWYLRQDKTTMCCTIPCLNFLLNFWHRLIKHKLLIIFFFKIKSGKTLFWVCDNPELHPFWTNKYYFPGCPIPFCCLHNCMCFSCCVHCPLGNFSLDRLLHTFHTHFPSGPCKCHLHQLFDVSSQSLSPPSICSIIILYYFIVLSHYYNLSFINNYLSSSLYSESSQHGKCLLLISVSALPSTMPH